MAQTHEFTERLSVSLSPSQMALAKVAAFRGGLPLAIWFRHAALTHPDYKAIIEEHNNLIREQGSGVFLQREDGSIVIPEIDGQSIKP